MEQILPMPKGGTKCFEVDLIWSLEVLAMLKEEGHKKFPSFKTVSLRILACAVWQLQRVTISGPQSVAAFAVFPQSSRGHPHDIFPIQL